MEVIPVINCLDFFCVKGELQKFRSFLKKDDWIKIDIADGKFTYHKTWNNPKAWADLKLSYKLEVHLMVESPEKFMRPWLEAGAKRLILHIETLKPETAEQIFNEVRNAGAEVMLSSNPDTPKERFIPYLKSTKYFQVLAVHPGLAGQKFLPSILEKIKFLSREAPGARIEVDGGMNIETARLVKDAGATALAVSTYILESTDQKKAYQTLAKIR